MRHAAALFLSLLLLAPARAEEEQAGAADAERVLRLEVSEVGRLALRNNPELAALRFDPDIANTGIQEAEAEFDTFLTGRTLFRRTREEVFFDPSAFASGGASCRRSDHTRDTVPSSPAGILVSWPPRETKMMPPEGSDMMRVRVSSVSQVRSLTTAEEEEGIKIGGVLVSAKSSLSVKSLHAMRK